MIRTLALLLVVLIAPLARAQATPKIYRLVGGVPTEIGVRDPAHRYKMFTGPDGLAAYLELTSTEETARDAEDAQPPAAFGGIGRVVAQRAGQVVPNNAGTAIDFTSETTDNAGYHDPVTNPDRVIIPVKQAGTYAIVASLRFNEASAAAGCTANSGDRLAQIRVSGSAVATTRVRAPSASDTEFQLIDERDLVAGDVVRVFVAHNCGGTLAVDARLSARRIPVSD